MGGFQAIQPVLSKESVWPAVMIAPTATSLPALAFSEDASQPHPNPAVQARERRAWLCLKYPNQPRSVGVRSLMIAGRLSPEVRFVFARIASLSFCMLLGRGKRICLPRTDSPENQRRPPSRRRSASSPDAVSGRLPPSILAPRPRLGGLLGASTQDHEIIRVTHHLESLLCHQMVQGIEIDVTEQRADPAPLGRPLSGVHSCKPSRTSCLRNVSIRLSTRPSDTF